MQRKSVGKTDRTKGYIVQNTVASNASKMNEKLLEQQKW